MRRQAGARAGSLQEPGLSLNKLKADLRSADKAAATALLESAASQLTVGHHDSTVLFWIKYVYYNLKLLLLYNGLWRKLPHVQARIHDRFYLCRDFCNRVE